MIITFDIFKIVRKNVIYILYKYKERFRPKQKKSGLAV